MASPFHFWNRPGVKFVKPMSEYFFHLGDWKIVSIEWNIFVWMKNSFPSKSRNTETFVDDLLINFWSIVLIIHFISSGSTLSKLIFLSENLYVNLPKIDTASTTVIQLFWFYTMKLVNACKKSKKTAEILRNKHGYF